MMRAAHRRVKIVFTMFQRYFTCKSLNYKEKLLMAIF